MTRLYVSGPMSGIADHNFPAFDRAAAMLRAWGYDVENPADKGIIDGWSWSGYLRHDIKLLVDCDGVALLPNWSQSRGARLEVAVAEGLELPCWSVDYWTSKRVDP